MAKKQYTHVQGALFCRQIKGFYQIVIFPETYGAPVSQMHSKVDHALYADSYSSSGISPEKLNMSSRGIEAPSAMPTTRATSSTY